MNHVSLAIVTRQGKFLILKRSPLDDNNPGRWALPGGHCERDESPQQGLLRELKEETNLESRPKFCKLLMRVPHSPTKLLNFYWVSKSKQNVELRDGEHTEFAWVEPQNLSMYDPLPYMNECFLKVQEYQNE